MMSAHVPASMVAAAIAFTVGVISSDDINSALSILIAITGLSVGIARYGAELRGTSKKRIERATAIGFFFGLAFSIIVLAFLLLLLS